MIKLVSVAMLLTLLVGCSLRMFTINDSSISSKPYEFGLLEINKEEKK